MEKTNKQTKTLILKKKKKKSIGVTEARTETLQTLQIYSYYRGTHTHTQRKIEEK